MKRWLVVLWLAVAITFKVAPLAAQQKRIPNRVVVLDQNGINPAAIKRAQGAFVLFILNHLPNKNETFTMAAVNPSPGTAPLALPSISTDSMHDHTAQTLNLPAGQYLLQLTNHPKLSVSITITQ